MVGRCAGFRFGEVQGSPTWDKSAYRGAGIADLGQVGLQGCRDRRLGDKSAYIIAVGLLNSFAVGAFPGSHGVVAGS